MKTKRMLTKAVALIGALLAWFPIVAAVVVAVAGSLRERAVRFDYLMPAELAPAAFLGGGLLLWAAMRAHTRRRPIALGLGLMVAMLVGGQALAVATGLASGAREPAGWAFALVLAALAAYTLALAEVAISGGLLVRDLFRRA
jgi:hypothetical protein